MRARLLYLLHPLLFFAQHFCIFHFPLLPATVRSLALSKSPTPAFSVFVDSTVLVQASKETLLYASCLDHDSVMISQPVRGIRTCICGGVFLNQRPLAEVLTTLYLLPFAIRDPLGRIFVAVFLKSCHGWCLDVATSTAADYGTPLGKLGLMTIFRGQVSFHEIRRKKGHPDELRRSVWCWEYAPLFSSGSFYC